MSETTATDEQIDVVADPARLAALDQYGILDTPPEQGFDDVVLLASQLCRTPVALVSFVAADRQWFKARVGFAPCETDLSRSVCAHGLTHSSVLVIPDLTLDRRTRDNLLVTGEPHIRFYAGTRLQTPEGEPLGMLCVIDTEPRPAGLSQAQSEALEALARQVMAQLELGRSVQAARRTLADTLVRSRTWQLSPEIMGMANADGYYEKSNPAWATVLGWSEEEVASTPILDFIHPDDLPSTQAAWEGLIDRGEPALRFENRYRAKDGGWRWLSWVAVPDDGKVYCTAREVTAEKEQARSLARSEEQLRQAQKLDAIGQLTGGVAHDFNNLLTVIRGSVDILRRDDLTDEKRARYIDAIGDTADRAAKLTGQLLAFARRQSLRPELFDAGKSLREVAEMTGTLIGSRIVLDIKEPQEPCFILADRGQFDTVLINLAINARDAMNGQGRLTMATGPVSGVPAIRSHPPLPGDFVAVTITDTGTGISAQDIGHIFEPFFTTKDIGKGTGLGLSQVFGFAKQSGGDIRVDSVEGEGTTFTLYLPRAYPDSEANEPDNADHAPVDGDGVCVLLVEDNDQVGEFATEALRELGYHSVHAIDAMRALAELEKDCSRFHIVFSDVVMPGRSGLELGQEVRRLYPDVPVILTSGYSHVLAQNGKHGFELLHKPYSVEQLSRVLRKAVAWAAGRQSG